MTTTLYAAWYISSNGQPVNGYTLHTSKRAAVADARLMRQQCLPLRSGGRAVAEVVASGERLYDWYEHAEGGYLAC